MMQLTLMIGGKEKSYRAAGLCLRTSLEAYGLYREYEAAQGDYSDELIERCLDYIRRIFGGAFSADELLDGYRESAFALIPGVLGAAIRYVNDEIVNFPNPAQRTPET